MKSAAATAAEPPWRKSSYSLSNGHCVEWRFRRSSFCADRECAEAALRQGTVLVRDSRDPAPELEFTPAEWTRFLAAIKNGAQ